MNTSVNRIEEMNIQNMLSKEEKRNIISWII